MVYVRTLKNNTWWYIVKSTGEGNDHYFLYPEMRIAFDFETKAEALQFTIEGDIDNWYIEFESLEVLEL